MLNGAADVDNWTLHRALSEPLEGLGGRTPMDAVAAESVEEVAAAVFNVPSIHTQNQVGGWEAGIRTPISRVRVCCPTIERPPNKGWNTQL